MATPLKDIPDLEVLVQQIVARSDHALEQAETSYTMVDPGDNRMLGWARSTRKYAQLQDLDYDLARVGTVGDGNCMLHAILFCMSPTYRSYNRKARTYIVDVFRKKVLMRRIDEISDITDLIYTEEGGAVALHDSIDNISKKRSELDLEIGPCIARLYNFNFLAVRLDDTNEMEPVCVTYRGYNSEYPTVLIHYLGGSTNVEGGKYEDVGGSGHYEAIFQPKLATTASTSPNSSNSTRKASSAAASAATVKAPRSRRLKVQLDDAASKYLFIEDEIIVIIAKFVEKCVVDVHASVVAAYAEAAAASAKKRSSSERRKTLKKKTSSKE